MNKYAALTFDDGPKAIFTPAILDTLKEYNVKATFFILGNRLKEKEAPDLLKRIHDEGHAIGNHTQTHADLSLFNKEQIREEFDKANASINNVLPDLKVGMLRNPYGKTNEFVPVVAYEMGVPLLRSSVGSRDWETTDEQVVYNNVMGNIKDGDIVGLHDIHQSTLKATPMIVKDLLERGFTLVTVPEMFRQRGVELQAGYVYTSGSNIIPYKG
jgi:peptidoglycan/xylan/chitin deacetylase (PgdA/CDA1 family)